MDILQERGGASLADVGQDISAQINIPEQAQEALANWIYTEIETSKAERQQLNDKVVEWERLYSARPKVHNKTFPWDHASNLVVPTIATAVDTVLARMLNAIFGSRDVLTAVGKSPDWADLADPLEKWLNWVGREVMNLYAICQTWCLSCVKYGTGILKLPWEQRRRNVTYKKDGEITQETIWLHNGPLPQNINITDFYVSNDAIHTQDIQGCEWVAHRTLYTWKRLKELETSGIFMDVDRIKDWRRTETTDLEDEVERNTGHEVNDYKDYDIWEIWCSYDTTGSGVLDELVVSIHLETRTILRAVYNFYRHQERPFHLIRYMVQDNSIYGIGLGQMLADIQEEISTIHNQRLDNATISNTTAFKRRRGTTVGQEKIYPGAFIDVDELDDIAELSMGTKHHTLLPEELHTNSIGEKRTGVNDYTVGRESGAIGSRATATSTLALIQEGNKRFQMTIRDIREALNNIAHQTIMLYQQFSGDDDVMYEMFSEKDKMIIQKYLHLPSELSRANVLIDTPAISESNNKDIQKQTYMTLMGVVQQFYRGLMEGFSVAVDPRAPEPMKNLAIQGATAASKIWERVLEAFDIVDAESYTPDIEQLLNTVLLQQMQGGMNATRVPEEQGGSFGSPQESSRQPVMGPGFAGNTGNETIQTPTAM